MTNPSKQKGTSWETRTVQHARVMGFHNAERRTLSGAKDRGDINLGVRGVVIECKNQKAFDLAGWMDETVVEMANDNAAVGAVVFPRRNHSVGRAFVLMEYDTFLNLLLDADYI